MKVKKHDINFLDYIDGQVSDYEAKEIERHLADCKKCSKELDYLKETYSLLDERLALEVNPFLHAKILAKLEAKSSKSVSAKVFSILKPISIAASVLVGVYLGSPVVDEYTSQAQTIDLDEELFMPDYDEVLLTINME